MKKKYTKKMNKYMKRIKKKTRMYQKDDDMTKLAGLSGKDTAYAKKKLGY